MFAWAHAGPAVSAAFLGSAVEAVEALTIVLATGIVRGWRSTMLGTLAGLLLLALAILLFGPALAAVPIHLLQLVVGSLLILFGMRWLRKAILRSGGLIALRDEAQLFEKQKTALGHAAGATQRWDGVAAVTAFKAVLLEGLEVVVIVIGVGASGGMLVPAAAGAGLACLAVVLAGLVLHKPLARVPENALKFAVGLLISAFGLYWYGEGIGIGWPLADAAILWLTAMLAGVAALAVWALRRAAGTSSKERA